MIKNNQYKTAGALDLSMLILKSVVKTMKNNQYKTAGTCLKRFYAAHQALKLFVRIIASFQVVLAKLAMPKFSLLRQKTQQRRAPDWLMSGRFTIASWVHHTLHAVQLGQCFFAFSAAWPFHVDLEITVVINTIKNNQYKTAGASLKGFYAAHQVLKVDCMDQSLFAGGARHIGYAEDCQSLVFRNKFSLAKD